MRRNLRALFRDPPPLALDEPAFADEEARAFYEEEQYNAAQKMRLHDRKPELIRRVNTAVNHVNIATHMVEKMGVRTAQQAEPIVREFMSGARRLPRGIKP